MNTIINERGALVLHIPGWMQNSQQYYAALRDSIPWIQPDVVVYGKKHKTPRLQYAVGDDGSRAYGYSNSDIPLHSWTNTQTLESEALLFLRQVRDAITADNRISGPTNQFNANSCLLNYYRNGQEYVGFHSDKEVRDVAQSVVTVSLGCSRTFRFRDKMTKKKTHDIVLNSGDLVLMCGNTQKLYEHSIPKVALSTCNEGRISLTYRLI